MNRKYTAAEYENSVKLLRKYFDNPAIATDIMVGFPGETDEEFDKSLAFAEKIAFADAHVFSYSNRRGTKADVMENCRETKFRPGRIMFFGRLYLCSGFPADMTKRHIHCKKFSEFS